ncbi:15785_t:CDS:1, partial [Funneliformis geosporum]
KPKKMLYERSDWLKEMYQNYFKDETISILGYRSQGSRQDLNARDNRLNIILRLREGRS